MRDQAGSLTDFYIRVMEMLYELSQLRKDPVLESVVKSCKMIMVEDFKNQEVQEGRPISKSFRLEKLEGTVFSDLSENPLLNFSKNYQKNLDSNTLNPNNIRSVPTVSSNDSEAEKDSKNFKEHVNVEKDFKKKQFLGDDGKSQTVGTLDSEKDNSRTDKKKTANTNPRVNITPAGNNEKVVRFNQRERNIKESLGAEIEHKEEIEIIKDSNLNNYPGLYIDNRPPMTNESEYGGIHSGVNNDERLVVYEEKEEVVFRNGKCVVETVYVERAINDPIEREMYLASQKIKEKAKKERKESMSQQSDTKLDSNEDNKKTDDNEDNKKTDDNEDKKE